MKRCKLSSDNARVNSAINTYRAPSEHYENFPVASWLCPPVLRAPIAAIYWFARTADDIADEGDADAATRLAALAHYRDDLLRTSRGQSHSERWPTVFEPLGRMIGQFQLPLILLGRLLDAFEQDVSYTATGRRYQSDAELHAYCNLSANPVGRLLLHLYGVQDTQALQRSDQVCTALQLINFWQDLGRDVAHNRWYPSAEQMTRYGVTEADLQRDAPSPAASRMVAAYCSDARERMLQGAPLARTIRGRAGWELRLVVLGGLRILEKIEQIDHATWRQRPRVDKRDLPILLWRACWPIPAARRGIK
jgi:squalene synthase HpnC